MTWRVNRGRVFTGMAALCAEENVAHRFGALMNPSRYKEPSFPSLVQMAPVDQLIFISNL